MAIKKWSDLKLADEKERRRRRKERERRLREEKLRKERLKFRLKVGGIIGGILLFIVGYIIWSVRAARLEHEAKIRKRRSISIFSSTGGLKYKKDKTGNWQKVFNLTQKFLPPVAFKTANYTKLVLKTDDGTVIKVKPDSVISIDDIKLSENLKYLKHYFSIKKGEMAIENGVERARPYIFLQSKYFELTNVSDCNYQFKVKIFEEKKKPKRFRFTLKKKLARIVVRYGLLNMKHLEKGKVYSLTAATSTLITEQGVEGPKVISTLNESW